MKNACINLFLSVNRIKKKINERKKIIRAMDVKVLAAWDFHVLLLEAALFLFINTWTSLCNPRFIIFLADYFMNVH